MVQPSAPTLLRLPLRTPSSAYSYSFVAPVVQGAASLASFGTGFGSGFGLGAAAPEMQGFVDIEIELVAETGTAAGLDSQSQKSAASAALFCPPLVWEVPGLDIPLQPPASWQDEVSDEVSQEVLRPCLATLLTRLTVPHSQSELGPLCDFLPLEPTGGGWVDCAGLPPSASCPRHIRTNPQAPATTPAVVLPVARAADSSACDERSRLSPDSTTAGGLRGRTGEGGGDEDPTAPPAHAETQALPHTGKSGPSIDGLD